MKHEIKNFFLSQINEHELVIEKTKLSVERNFLNLVNICVKSLKNRKKIIFFGNGGSASDAQHLSTELTVRFCENRKSIPAISLVTDTSAISAIGNDFAVVYDDNSVDHFKKRVSMGDDDPCPARNKRCQRRFHGYFRRVVHGARRLIHQDNWRLTQHCPR